MTVDPEIMQERQRFFWRRNVLITNLAFNAGATVYALMLIADKPGDWPIAAVIIVMTLANLFLTMAYFAAVDSAERIKTATSGIVEGLARAKDAAA
jgi:hypothetical protein